MYIVSTILVNGERLNYGYSEPLSAICKFNRERQNREVLDVSLLDMQSAKIQQTLKSRKQNKSEIKL